MKKEWILDNTVTNEKSLIDFSWNKNGRRNEGVFKSS